MQNMLLKNSKLYLKNTRDYKKTTDYQQINIIKERLN